MQVFDTIKEQGNEHLFKKLSVVAGDVGQDNLGLSEADRQTLCNNVQIVFHSAATLDFEADLKSTAEINLLGTRRVVQLCNEIKNLEVQPVIFEPQFCSTKLHNYALFEFLFLFLQNLLIQ